MVSRERNAGFLLPEQWFRMNGIPALSAGMVALKVRTAGSKGAGILKDTPCVVVDLSDATELCKKVLALPIHPYLEMEEQELVVEVVRGYLRH